MKNYQLSTLIFCLFFFSQPIFGQLTVAKGFKFPADSKFIVGTTNFNNDPNIVSAHLDKALLLAGVEVLDQMPADSAAIVDKVYEITNSYSFNATTSAIKAMTIRIVHHKSRQIVTSYYWKGNKPATTVIKYFFEDLNPYIK